MCAAHKYLAHQRNKTDLPLSTHFNPQASSSGTEWKSLRLSSASRPVCTDWALSAQGHQVILYDPCLDELRAGTRAILLIPSSFFHTLSSVHRKHASAKLCFIQLLTNMLENELCHIHRIWVHCAPDYLELCLCLNIQWKRFETSLLTFKRSFNFDLWEVLQKPSEEILIEYVEKTPQICR